MKFKTLFSIVLLFFASIQSGLAQTTNKRVKTQKDVAQPSVDQSKLVPPTSFTPVFWKDDISPVEYIRNDPVKVFDWLETQIKSVPGQVDQFSTRDERQQYETALTEKMKKIGQFAFISNCLTKYDAECQIFEIKDAAFAIKDNLLKEPNPEALKLRKLTLGKANAKKDTYTGQNAYGATTEIIRDVSDDYVFAYPSGANFEPSSIIKPGSTLTSASIPYRYNFIYYLRSLPMSSAEAREKYKDISCLAVVSIEPPYVFRFKELDLPTRDFPFERISNGFAIYGKLDQLWVVNKVTGEVYLKHSRSGQ